MTIEIYHKCPNCGTMLIAIAPLGADGRQNVIRPGDFTVCPVCAWPLQFHNDHFHLVQPEQVEKELSPDELEAFKDLRADILKKLIK